jgi:N-Dimethylarginine dimethylaminohydrolase
MRILVRPPAEEDCDLGGARLACRARLLLACTRARGLPRGPRLSRSRGDRSPRGARQPRFHLRVRPDPDHAGRARHPPESGKGARRGEPEALRPALEAAGVAIAGQLADDELAEGGDTVWLDDSTLLVGHTYRTNEAGIEALRRLLPGVDVARSRSRTTTVPARCSTCARSSTRSRRPWPSRTCRSCRCRSSSC